MTILVTASGASTANQRSTAIPVSDAPHGDASFARDRFGDGWLLRDSLSDHHNLNCAIDVQMTVQVDDCVVALLPLRPRGAP